VPEVNIIDMAASVDVPVAIGGKIDDTEVNAKCVSGFDWFSLSNFAGRQQVKLAALEGQPGFALLGLKHLKLVLACGKGNILATVYYPNRHRLRIGKLGQNPTVISNSTMRSEHTPGSLAFLVGISNFRKTANNHLCGQSMFSANSMIGQLLERIFTELLFLPGLVTDVVAGSVSYFKCLLQKHSLLRRWKQFYFRSQSHVLDPFLVFNILLYYRQ